MIRWTYGKWNTHNGDHAFSHWAEDGALIVSVNESAGEVLPAVAWLVAC
jgi:hypothetical protein